MSVGITFDELLAWNERRPAIGKPTSTPTRLCSNCPAASAAQPTCRSLSATSGAWSCAGPSAWPGSRDAREKIPAGPLDALFDLHRQAVAIFRNAARRARSKPGATLTFSISIGCPPEKRTVSRRKIAAHALFHSQRHWAQLATLVRNAGFPSKFRGDLLFSPALR